MKCINDHDSSLVTGRLTNNMLVHFPGDESLIGNIVDVKLTECKGFYYMGEMLIMAEYSPMMQHYLETKKQYNDCILFYRLGDFYEMFFDDAHNCIQRTWNLHLQEKTADRRNVHRCVAFLSMLPRHISNRLVSNGHKVAICEQVEDPKLAKGIVKREVIRSCNSGNQS